MKAILPSVDATTSCGSGPEGMRATTFRVIGLRIDNVCSAFERMSSDSRGVGSTPGSADAAKESNTPGIVLRCIYRRYRTPGTVDTPAGDGIISRRSPHGPGRLPRRAPVDALMLSQGLSIFLARFMGAAHP